MELVKSYAKAVSDCENPPLDSMNPHFHSKFASLSATLGVIRAACRPQGISYVQHVIETNGGAALVSEVVSDKGERMELSRTPLVMPPDAQKFGIELTYKKRQTAQADFGVCGEEDDDAEGASRPAKEPKKPKRDYSPVNDLLVRYQICYGMTEADAKRSMSERFGSLKEMSDIDYARFITNLDAELRGVESEHQ